MRGYEGRFLSPIRTVRGPEGLAVSLDQLVISTEGVFDTGWWSTDRLLTVLFGVAGVAALGIAIWQILRTRRAAEAAEVASKSTHQVLRTSDLRRALEVSLEIGRRIDAERSSSTRTVFLIHFNDWLAASHRIHALWASQAASQKPTWVGLQPLLESARGEILAARDAADDGTRWRAYDRGVLRRTLSAYADGAERAIVSGDDRMVRSNDD